MGLRFITPLLSKVSHKKGCQMRSDISKRNHTATTVCSSKKVVCHRVAGVPAQRHKARAEGLWIETFAWFCKSLTCLFPLGSLNGEVYILCPAGVSLFESVSLALFPTQSPNIYRCRGKSSSAEGSVRISLNWWWIYLREKIPYLEKHNVSTERDHYGVIYVIGQFRFSRVPWYLQPIRMLGKNILCAAGNNSIFKTEMNKKREKKKILKSYCWTF